MTLYRSKRAVEAMQWDGESHTAFEAWAAQHGIKADLELSDNAWMWTLDDFTDWHVMPSCWVVFKGAECNVLTDEQFRAEYEEVV